MKALSKAYQFETLSGGKRQLLQLYGYEIYLFRIRQLKQDSFLRQSESRTGLEVALKDILDSDRFCKAYHFALFSDVLLSIYCDNYGL